MQTEIIVAIVGIVGAILGAIITQLLTSRKTDAEIDKLRAETEKARAEAEKLRVEMVQLTPQIATQVKEVKGDNKMEIATDVIPTQRAKDFKPSENYREHPSPSEILKSVSDLPEYQTEAFLESYVGLNVRWSLNFITMSAKGDLADIVCNSRGAEVTPVSFVVNISDYPELKLLKTNSKIMVSGRISRISKIAGYGIYLADCFLEFK